MSLFDLTEADLNDGKATFNDGDTATLTIAGVAKKIINDNPNALIECVVLDGANAGLKHTIWFSLGSNGGKKALGIFLTSFMTATEAANMSDPNVLINRQFTCKFVGAYKNVRNVKELSQVPQMAAAPVAQQVQQAVQQVVPQTVANPVPTQQAVAAQVELGKSLF